MLTLEEATDFLIKHENKKEAWARCYAFVENMEDKSCLDSILPRIKEEAPEGFAILSASLMTFLSKSQHSEENIQRMIALLCPSVMVTYMGVDNALLDALKKQVGFVSDYR